MPIKSMVRLSVFSLCCIAMLQFIMTETAQAQLPPPPPSTPQAGSGGNKGGDKGDQDKETTRGGFKKLRSSQGNMGEDKEDSKKPKFDDLLKDRDLSRFRGYKQESIGDGWDIKSSTLHLNGEGGDIVTRDEYENFELHFDFKISEGGNSGVMYLVSLGDDAPYFSGPEFQILDDEKHADGQNEMTSCGSLYAMYAPENKKPKAAGSWNKGRIIVDGNKITHYLNGVKVVEVEKDSDDWNKHVAESKFKEWDNFGQNLSGHIAFQDHGDEVWFRKIRIKRLNSDDDDDDGGSSIGSKPSAQAPVGRKFKPLRSSQANESSEPEDGGKKKDKDK